MPPFLKRIRSRTSERLDRAAIGGSQPAGSEPAPSASAQKPSARERGTMRRRLRRLAKVREAMLLDLGALTFEMHRQERQDPTLIERKAKEALAVDAEARGLALALDEELPFNDVIASGIAGTCANCNAILAADARYCSSCGTAVGAQPAAPAAPAAAQPPAPASLPAASSPAPVDEPAAPFAKAAPPARGAEADPDTAAGNGHTRNGARAHVPWAEDFEG